MLVLSAAWQLFDAGASVLAEALRAAGDTAVPDVDAGGARLAACSCRAASSSVRVRGRGDTASRSASLVVYLFALALVLLLRFRSGAWRRIALVEAGAAR